MADGVSVRHYRQLEVQRHDIEANWVIIQQKIIRRGAKNTRRSIQKNLNDSDNHDGVISHLEPDILECKVKWALRNITTNKASGGDGIPVELFQILEDDGCQSAAVNMPANLENSAVATGLEKISFHSSPKRKAMPKKAQTTAQLHSSHTLAK